jgi:hypothetical protein
LQESQLTYISKIDYGKRTSNNDLTCEVDGLLLKNVVYVVNAIILGVIAIFTGEIVTLIMLGLILMTLETIASYLKKIYETLNKNDHKF